MNIGNNKNRINGVFTDHICVDDRAFQYGDGLFETLLCNDKKLYYWSQHYQRLQRSADKLAIKCPDEDVLLDDVYQLLNNQKNNVDKPCAIKIILTRGVSERGYRYLNNIDSNRLVSLSGLKTDYSSLLSMRMLSGELFSCSNQVSINESLAGLKHLNRLENVLARNEWIDTPKHHYIDGLMMDADQHVIECTTSNIFAVKNGQLLIPDLQRSGVRGIMRDEVIDIATDLNIDVSVCNIGIDALRTVDELFITNSLIGLKSVTKCGDIQYKEPRISQLIFDALLSTKENHVQII